MKLHLRFDMAIVACLSLPTVLAGVVHSRSSSLCRYLPGDSGWPSIQAWSQLNSTVQGRLIATVPLGSPCHDPTYNATECAVLSANWALPQYQFDYPSAIMLPYFQGNSCSPYTPETTPCTLGNLVDYSINVTSAEDVLAGVKFAQEANIRLVIKNTGHDFLGKSTGKGALGIWTHHLKSISFVNYTSQQYSGPAIKMGAGVQAWEAYEAASANGVRVVGGTCPTVGLAGGYTQGGGHSTLSSLYGLGADQALEWEVVTADGQYLVATPTQYSDLYWALSGGGGGTYAVVLSLTAKAHRDGVVGGASISFSSQGISQATYWDAIGYWLPLVTKLSDAGGASSVFTITSEAFNLGPYTSDGKSVAEVKAELKPFVVELDKRNMTYSYNVTSLPGFLQHFTTYLGPLPYGQYGTGEILGSRLIPQSLVASDNAALTSALRNITDAGFLIDGLTQTPTHAAASNTAASNAVLPAWRVSAAHIVVSIAWNYTAPWASNVAREDEITHVIVPQLEDITPDSGTYLNEGDFQLVTWKRDFYGSNYDRLRAVKTAYDGHDLFYATTAVGSDAWIVAEDGRLCRAA